MATRVKIGQLNSYIPTVEKDKKTGIWTTTRNDKVIDEEGAKLLRQAAWKIPQACHKFALPLDGSNWKFQSGLWDRAKAIKEEYHGKHGIRIYASPTVTWDNEEDMWDEIREAVTLGVEAVKESLVSSMKVLEKQFDEIPDFTESDGKIVDRVNDATARLKNLSFVIASLALSEDFREAEKGVSIVIEEQLVAARRELGKRILKAEEANT